MTQSQARSAVPTAAAFVLAVLLAAFSAALPAVAAPGDAAHTWAGLGFRAGLVCSSGGATSPLASWDLGGGYSSAYLVQPVTAAGNQVSAVPPLASLGPQSTSTVTSGGSVGQLDPSQVPALAALLSRYGASGDDTTVAALAHLVMSAVGGDAGLPACSDAGREAQLQAAAAQLAGPYTLDFSPHTGQSLPGRADSLTVTVLGGSGAPVPGVKVTFDADTPVFGSSTTAQGTTDSSGHATVAFTVPAGTSTPGISVNASATVATALTSVSVQATPTATNPSGSSVAALVPTADSTAQATTSVSVDRGAHPRIALAADPSAVLRGSAITPALTVSGLNGHQATATVTTVGPLPLADRALCGDRGASDFAGGRLRSVDSTVDVAGDGVVKAASVTLQAPGCYWSTARLATTDATPRATASASLDHAITVLDTAVSAHLVTPLVGRNGSSDLALQVQRTHSASLSVRTVVTGPVLPPQSADGCSAVDYSGAASVSDDADLQSGAPSAPSGAPGSATTSSPAPAGVAQRYATVRPAGLGCSRVQTHLILHTGSQDLDVQVPMTGTNDLLAIAPKVQVSTERSWGQTGQAVSVAATVSSSFGQPGHVSVRLRRTPTSEFGCRGATFTHAVTGAAGAGAPVTTDYSAVQVRSVVLSQTGCYLPVVTLRMDDNSAVTASSSVAADAVIAVGVDPTPAAASSRGSTRPDGPSVQPIVVALIVFVAAVLAAILAILRLAREPESDQGPSTASLVLKNRPSPH